MDRTSATEYSPERDPFKKFDARNVTEQNVNPSHDSRKEFLDKFTLKKVNKEII